MPPVKGVAVLEDDDVLCRLLVLREQGVAMGRGARDDESRLRALLVVTSLTEPIADRLPAVVEKLGELSTYDPDVKAGSDWIKKAIDVLRSSETLIAQRDTLASNLGARGQAIIDELDTSAATSEQHDTRGNDELSPIELSNDVPVLGEDKDLLSFVRARNEGGALMVGADSRQEYLVGMAMLTNMSEATVARMRDLLPELRDLPPAELSRAKRAAEQLTQRISSYPRFLEEQKTIVAELGVALSQDALDQAASRIQAIVGPDVHVATEQVRAAGSSDDKVCPDCAETIKGAARVCRFCGYRFEVPL